MSLKEEKSNEEDLNEDDLNEDDLNKDDLNKDDLDEEDLDEEDLDEKPMDLKEEKLEMLSEELSNENVCDIIANHILDDIEEQIKKLTSACVIKINYKMLIDNKLQPKYDAINNDPSLTQEMKTYIIDSINREINEETIDVVDNMHQYLLDIMTDNHGDRYDITHKFEESFCVVTIKDNKNKDQV